MCMDSCTAISDIGSQRKIGNPYNNSKLIKITHLI